VSRRRGGGAVVDHDGGTVQRMVSFLPLQRSPTDQLGFLSVGLEGHGEPWRACPYGPTSSI
jgi:hypothetical protein